LSRPELQARRKRDLKNTKVAGSQESEKEPAVGEDKPHKNQKTLIGGEGGQKDAG